MISLQPHGHFPKIEDCLEDLADTRQIVVVLVVFCKGSDVLDGKVLK